MKKEYIDVIQKNTKEGMIIPLEIIWKDGRRFEIDKVINIQKSASLKGGGVGVRYKCRICNKEIYLWLDDNKWFIEC